MTDVKTSAAGTTRLPGRKHDRRPALIALALLLVLGGALGSALVAYRSGQRVDVLVAAKSIPIGHQVTRADFTVARVASSDASVASASDESAYLGSYATTSIPQGTLVNGDMFKVGHEVPEGAQLVGMVVPRTQSLSGIGPGDVVAVYFVAGKNQSGDNHGVKSGTRLLKSARVVDAAAHDSGGDSTVALTLLVPDKKVKRIVADASTQQLAVTRMPDGTVPEVDLVGAKE